MRIAALYDIHGNLPALEAVLDEITHLGVDEIVVGGDLVLGPMSLECLEKMLSQSLPVHFIYGNCEVAVLNHMKNQSPGNLPEAVLEDIRWTAESLLPVHEKIMSKWPPSVTIYLESIGNVLFCHATPRNENEIFSKLTDEQKLKPIFEPLDVDYVVCGHTHMQFDRTVGKVRVINSGSVGMPFGHTGADWLLLGPDVELRHTDYDLTKAVERLRKTPYPRAEEFATKNVLQPQSEEAMLKIFAGSELKN